MSHSMKTIATLAIFGAILTTNSFAQQSFNAAEPVYAKNTLELPAMDAGAANSVLNAKTEARLMELYPQASEVVWSKMQDNYYVSFLNQGRKAKASFSAKGKMNYCITECSAQQLPADLLSTIRKEYTGYTVFNSVEINAHNTTAYQAIIENNVGFITLRYSSNTVEEVEQVKK